uniref:uncharacterized protein LOC120344529 n=1 Tax=Styela clava TaxID=7725 RepID=UPI0019396ABA|nr:uncharacterized protein LOC120344529 [Styela clava]
MNLASYTTLLTYNVNGMRNFEKRKSIFDYIRNIGSNITFIQETHCGSEDDAKKWTKEWGELISTNIRCNRDIIGFKNCTNQRDVYNGFADDITLMLESMASVDSVLKLMELLESGTGQKINRDKCTILLCGSSRSWQINNTYKDIALKREEIKLLGIYIGNSQKSRDKNWSNILANVQKIVNLWKGRNLTIVGRVVVAKSLMLSKLWYMASFEFMPEKYIQKMETIIWKFIWNDKAQMINRNISCSEFFEGGVKMMNIRNQIKALQVKWVLKLLEGCNNPWSQRAKYFVNNYFDVLSKGNLECLYLNFKLETNIHIPKFYTSIINSFKQIGLKWNQPQNIAEISQEIIWHNPLILDRNNIEITAKSNWVQAKIITVSDIFGKTIYDISKRVYPQLENSAISTLRKNCLINKCENELRQIWEALPIEWREILSRNREFGQTRILIDRYNGSKDLTTNQIYRILQSKKNDTFLKNHKEYIFNKFHLTKAINWNKIWKINIGNKYKELCWKLIHNGLPTGDKIKHWFIDEPGMCVLCENNVEETVCHLFLECDWSSDFWQWCCIDINQNTIIANESECKSKLITILCGKSTIWEYRNSVKYDEIDKMKSSMRSIFKCKLVGILNLLKASERNELLLYEHMDDLLHRSIMM